jgi:hypothetical protein
MQEIWKDIPGYEGMYQVSNLGNVKSLDKLSNHYQGGKSKLKGRMLSQCNCMGYKIVGLSLNGSMKSLRVHRLVAIAFIPNKLNKPQVNHINGDKFDNAASNLEWNSASENILHAHRTGLHRGSHRGLFGKYNPNSKPIIQFDLNGNFISEYGGIAEAERHTSIYSQNICYACNGKYKQAGGFLWRYKPLTK